MADTKLMKRYRDAYRSADAIVTFGNLVKVFGWIFAIIAGLVTVGGAIGNGSVPMVVGGMIVGVLVLVIFNVIGIVIGAQGQLLYAQLDTAVSLVPFFSDKERSFVMSLEGSASVPPANSLDVKLPSK